MGIAASVANDADLASHPSVLYYDDLYSNLPNFYKRWETSDTLPAIVPGTNEPCTFDTYGLPGMRVWCAAANKLIGWHRQTTPTINQTSYPGTSQPYQVPYFGGPTHLFVRYLLRAGTDTIANDPWQAGKLPGMCGMYDLYTARVVPPYAYFGDYTKQPSMHGCWEARVHYNTRQPNGSSRLAIYYYGVRNQNGHGASPGVYYGNGDPDGPIMSSGWLIPGQTHCIEQEIQLNTLVDDEAFFDEPGTGESLAQCAANANNDGVIRLWLDGTLVLEHTNMAFRGMDAVRIQDAPFFNIYQGGTGNAPVAGSEHYDVGAVCCATEYIGPPNTSSGLGVGRAGNPFMRRR